MKNYDDLRDPDVPCPRLLVLLVLPEAEAEWLSQSEVELALRGCAYWVSLKGREPAPGQKTVRITIPRTNVFSVEALQAMFARIRQGGEP